MSPTAPGRPIFRIAAAVAAALGIAACGSGDAGSAPPDARTPFLPAASARSALIWAVGDGANGSDAAKGVADRIASARFDRLLYLGDVYPSGTAQDFARNYAPTYGPLARKTAPTPGNHDWPNRASGYRPYWRAARGVAVPDWYSFRAGGWTILALNSEAPHGRGSPQERWLRAQVRP